MFKKTLVAMAALAAFGTSAYAANVQLYGVVDTGLMYTHERTPQDPGDGYVSTDSLTMESGMNAPSRFGLKGVEDLGNGLKVGFKLENGFNSDDGTLGNGGRLFGREASLSVYTDYGTVSLGRMGGVGSSAGTYDLVYGIADAFDGGDNNILGLSISDRYDNMITYQSPKLAGLQLTMQHSFNAEGAEAAQSSKNNRYSSAAVTGEFGALNTVVAYEYMNRASDNPTYRNGHTVYVGANYDCGFAKTFAMAQYFKGSDTVFGGMDYETDVNGDATEMSKGGTGYGLHLGTIVPVAGGDVTVGAYFVDAKVKGWADASGTDDVNTDVTYYGLSARYGYSLSKRTTVYTGAGYAKTTFKEDGDKEKDQIAQVYMGLTHTF